MINKIENKIPVVAVVGPTASGKSNLGVEIALRKNGEIVSADSMQIYKEMNIGTAKPTEEEMKGVPHHLIDFVEINQTFSVADYVSLASKCISEIYEKNKLPLIVGGTGLYVNSLLNNIQFYENDKDDKLREELTEKAEKEGSQVLVSELKSFDPESANRIHPNNISRLIRAIEIYRTTGVTMTEQIRKSKEKPAPYKVCYIGLDYKNRQNLYSKINKRVDTMIKNGLIDEAREILNKSNSKTALQAIGYKELIPYFNQKCTLDEAVDNIKRESRRYAKRQLTWFRRNENINWIYLDDYKNINDVTFEALNIIDREG
jgi:tRNA dimethylallyltransferase